MGQYIPQGNKALGFGLSVLCLLACSAAYGQTDFPGPGTTPIATVRRYVPCVEFDKMVGVDTKLFPAAALRTDTTALPADFPKAPRGVSSCGCHAYISMDYFRSDLNYLRLYNHYKPKLEAQGYKVSEPGPNSENPKDTEIIFQGPKGNGYILVYGELKAYAISYRVPSKPCNCGSKPKL